MSPSSRAAREMFPPCFRKASAIIRRSTSANASASVTLCNELTGIEARVEAGELGVAGAEVRLSSGDKWSGVITVPSSARATTR